LADPGGKDAIGFGFWRMGFWQMGRFIILWNGQWYNQDDTSGVVSPHFMAPLKGEEIHKPGSFEVEEK
jgi:hypothetical protein